VADSFGCGPGGRTATGRGVRDRGRGAAAEWMLARGNPLTVVHSFPLRTELMVGGSHVLIENGTHQ
jgi:hypothetical protein